MLAAQVAAPLLVALGLSIPFDATCMWRVNTAWAIFAMVAALVQLATLVNVGPSPQTGWTVGAAATACLVLFWVLIALPTVASNAGFCLTLGTFAAVAGCALSPARRW